MSVQPIRVLVADDSITVRKRICEVIQEAPEFELIGEADNGQQAFELCQRLRPDVVSMDMMMPQMTGLTATEYIMAHCPTPILIVSASLNRGEVFHTYEALAAGAVDVLEKPRVDEPDQAWEGRLLSALRVVSRVKVITHPRARLGSLGQKSGSLPPRFSSAVSARSCKLLALGASTGGPGALVEILQALPPGLKVPILLVLHISEPFGAELASWLNSQSTHRVRYARDGELLSQVKGVVMAPPGQHMLLSGDRLLLNREPERHSCRPSVDVLFESLAREMASSTAACLLTGMGRDGAAGLLALRMAGALTMAQDEASSVVYGMPREAALIGAAELILPLDKIADALASAAGQADSRSSH